MEVKNSEIAKHGYHAHLPNHENISRNACYYDSNLGYWCVHMSGTQPCLKGQHPWPNVDGTLGPRDVEDDLEASWE